MNKRLSGNNEPNNISKNLDNENNSDRNDLGIKFSKSNNLIQYEKIEPKKKIYNRKRNNLKLIV